MNGDEAQQSFRDIRQDLKARLREAATNHEFHTVKAKEYGAEVDLITQLLDREESRFVAKKRDSKEPDEPLGDFLLKTLQIRPMSKEDLRDYATRAGYDVDGRSIHATLVNLSRTNRVKEIADGVYAPFDYKPTPTTIQRRL